MRAGPAWLEPGDAEQEFRPRGRRAGLVCGMGAVGRVPCAARCGRGAVYHHDPAAERDRQPAHGPRADDDAAGRADPLAADAGAGCVVAAGHGPCGHRDADGGRAAAGDGEQPDPAGDGTGAVHRAGLAVEGGERGGDHEPAPHPWGVIGLAAGAVHDGRGPERGGAGGVRHAAWAGADLPGPAAGELGPEVPVGDQRPGGRERRGERVVVVPALSGGGDGPGDRGGDDAAGDDAGGYGGRGASGGCAVRGAGGADGGAAVDGAAVPDHRRRVLRHGEGDGGGEDHAGARLQRFRGRAAAWAGDAVGAGPGGAGRAW